MLGQKQRLEGEVTSVLALSRVSRGLRKNCKPSCGDIRSTPETKEVISPPATFTVFDVAKMVPIEWACKMAKSQLELCIQGRK